MTTQAPLRLGGVPEHLNTPWYLARERNLAQDGPGWTWTDCPGGTGEMCRMLDSGALDAAVLLTEGAAAYIAQGADARIVHTWTRSPLTWGIHVRSDADLHSAQDLRGRRYGYSRLGSGSHLMALVDAEQRGWPDEDDPVLVEVGNFEGAKQAFARGEIDAFLWEQFMTRPMVHAGLWRCVDICRAPWPAFVVCARQDTLAQRGEQLHQLLRQVNTICLELHAHPEDTIAQVTRRFSLREEDARQWLAQMQWDCSPGIDHDALQTALRFLVQVGSLDREPALADLLADLPG